MLTVKAAREDVYALIDELGVEERARELMEAYKEEATRVLRRLDNANVKGLLRRTVGKIFNDLEIKGWCHEFEARNASGVEDWRPSCWVSRQTWSASSC